VEETEKGKEESGRLGAEKNVLEDRRDISKHLESQLRIAAERERSAGDFTPWICGPYLELSGRFQPD